MHFEVFRDEHHQFEKAKTLGKLDEDEEMEKGEQRRTQFLKQKLLYQRC